MFSSGCNYSKLKTNLRLCINRLKLLEKKKTEMAMKSRKEIADYITGGKVERAKIRVEHIIREDYMVEAMEVLEMYCDLLLARFGLIQQMKTLDDGLAEAISSIIWVAPRMQADVQELKIVSEQLGAKYGKPYAQACRENAVGTVSAKLMHKLSVQAPPKLTVEKYLIEIARYYSVEYEPDPQVMQQDEVYSADALIDLVPSIPDKNDFDLDDEGGPGKGGGGGGGGGGFAQPTGGYQQPPPSYTPTQPQPFSYPSPGGAAAYPPPGAAAYPPGAAAYVPPGVPYPHPDAAANPAAPFSYNIQPEDGSPNENYEKKINLNDSDEGAPPPYFPPDVTQDPPPKESPGFLDLPDLPAVPSDTPLGGGTPNTKDDGDDIDFDDLTKRFEALKKKK